MGFVNPMVNDIVFNVDTALCATNKGIFKSTDNGFSWLLLNNNLKDSSVYCLEKLNQKIYCSTRHSIYESSNNGTAFSLINQLQGKINKISAVNSDLFTATSTGGYLYNTNALAWFPTLPGININSFVKIDTMVYATSFEKGVHYIWAHKITPTGIEEVKFAKNDIEFEIYPNPSMDEINFSFQLSDNYRIEIYNSEGKKVVEHCLSNKLDKLTLDVSKLLNGMYYIKVTNKEERISTKKIIVLK